MEALYSYVSTADFHERTRRYISSLHFAYFSSIVQGFITYTLSSSPLSNSHSISTERVIS
jgi:hypothetical protein